MSLYTGTSLLAPGRLLPGHPVGASLRSLFTSKRLRRLRCSPPGAPRCCLSRAGPLPRLSTSTTPMPAPLLSYRRIQCPFPGRRPCHASLHQHARAASGDLLPAQLDGAYPWRAPLLRLPPSARPRRLRSSPSSAPRCFLPREGPLPRLPTSGTPTPPPVVSYRRSPSSLSREGALPRLPLSVRPCRLRPSPTGAPR